LAESGVYHVMMRGVNKDAIFLEDEDRVRFLHALTLTKQASGCIVLAYCLMTNHVHLVLQTPDEPISLVMKRLGVRYVGWFNRKYSRVGHLFQDRFASIRVEDDAHLIVLLRYVWNNPVEACLTERPEDYRWSSRSPLQVPGLVDAAVLRRLVPPDVVDGPVVDPRRVPSFDPPKAGRPPSHTDDEAAAMLQLCSGASCPGDFLQLDRSAQRRAVRELRTRSVSYLQIAKVTGWSATTVRRAQVSGA
jgi:REP element-mobilizing transposase RayT